MRTVIVAIFVSGELEKHESQYLLRTERVASSMSARDYCTAFDVASEAIVKVKIVIIAWKDSIVLPSYILSSDKVSSAICSVGLQFKKLL